ncbi:MAG TPA: hypothetical protein DER33_06375 [Syntrophomonas sp.]|jgi:hypothetical protein|nr:hypothetical protein [Syntrophomonas sp.]
MRTFLNGKEMEFSEFGYEYVFIKPYQRHTQDMIKRENGDQLHLQLYDNGVQIRTLMGKDEINTLINRDIAVDEVNNKIYILEPGYQAEYNPDGSINIKLNAE